MITREHAQALVREELNRLSQHHKGEFVIPEDQTLEREFGWVFFYQSREFLKTGDYVYQLAGNVP